MTSRTVIVAGSQYSPTNEIWAMSQGAKSQYRLHCDGRKRVESNVDSRAEIVSYRLNHPETRLFMWNIWGRTRIRMSVAGLKKQFHKASQVIRSFCATMQTRFISVIESLKKKWYRLDDFVNCALNRGFYRVWTLLWHTEFVDCVNSVIAMPESLTNCSLESALFNESVELLH